MSKKIAIIGGGPAGVEAALEAKKSGTSVIIINDGPIGGRAGWHSLLPSKVWLSAADTLSRLGGIDKTAAIPNLSPANVVQRIASVKQEWNKRTASILESSGVELVTGTAVFVDEKNVEVRDSGGENLRLVEADVFIVASGSVPLFPPNLKPDGKRVIAPRFASHLNRLSASMIVVGAGPTGCESAYLFNRFGVEVTWIVDQFGVLPQMHQDLGYHLGKELVGQGVHLIQGQMVDRLERKGKVTAVLADGTRYSAEMAFVAIGRKPDWSRLNLPAAGVSPNVNGQMPIDGYGRVKGKNIYFVGDAAGGALIANKAMAQARIAGRHAAGAAVGPYDPNLIVQVTYTDPQAAQIGDISVREGVKTARVPFASALKAHLVGETKGYLELFYDESDGKLLGAAAIGSHAADVLSPISVALQAQATVLQLAEIYGPHPSLSELPYIAARSV